MNEEAISAIIYALFSIYWLLVILLCAYLLYKRKKLLVMFSGSVVLQMLKAREKKIGTLASTLTYIPVFLIYASVWPFLLCVAYAYYIHQKKQGIEYRPGNLGFYGSLHAHAEWYAVLILIINAIIFCVTLRFSVPANLLHILAISSLIYTISYSSFNLISSPEMLLGRIKISIFNVRLFYVLIVITLFCLNVLSFSFLLNGSEQSVTQLIETGKRFLLLNPVQDWMNGKAISLDASTIGMALCTLVFGVSSSISIRNFIILKRDTKDLLLMSFAWMTVHRYDKAKELLQAVPAERSVFESRIVSHIKANIAIREKESQIAFREFRGFLNILKDTKYVDALTYGILFHFALKSQLDEEVIQHHFEYVLDQDLNAFIFYQVINDQLTHLRKKNKSLKRFEIMPQNEHYQGLRSNDLAFGVLYSINEPSEADYEVNFLSVTSIQEQEIADLVLKYYLMALPGLTYKNGDIKALNKLEREIRRLNEKIAQFIEPEVDLSIVLMVMSAHNIVKGTMTRFGTQNYISVLEKKLNQFFLNEGFDNSSDWLNSVLWL